MDVDNFTKLLAYLVVMINLLAHSCCSHDHVQTQDLAPVTLPGGNAHSLYSYRRILFGPAPEPSSPLPLVLSDTSPPSPPSDTADTSPSSLPSGGPETSPSSPPSGTAPETSPPSPPIDPPVTLPPSQRSDAPGPSPPSPPNETIPRTLPAPTPSPATATKNETSVVVAVSVSVVFGVLFFFGVFGWLFLKRKKNLLSFLKNITSNESTNSDAPMSRKGATAPGGNSTSDDSDVDPASAGLARKLPKMYPYNSLASATSNFNEQNKLGEGGFGPVFKGFLNNGKVEVAIKRVSKITKEATKQYKAEVKILTRLSHRNLVELLGWCDHEEKFLLVYKFMSNGSLNSQLYNKSRLLTWGERYNIVLGLASALNYLHEECEACVLHRDIKPDNVLLDSSFNAKLSDFGLARLVDHDLGAKHTTLAGTMAYMAPEHLQESRASKESDIYSFGVVLLEIACGRVPITRDAHTGVITNLIDLVWDHYGRKEILTVADKRLNGGYIAEEMECVMTVGLWCAHPIYTERPTIGHVIKVLKFDAPLPELPLSKPPLFFALSQYKSVTENSSSIGLSASSGCTAVSSQVASSTSGSAAMA